MVFLDIEKAFDSVVWDYLWQVMGALGTGPKYIAWVKLLYRKPLARVRTGKLFWRRFSCRRTLGGAAHYPPCYSLWPWSR